MEETLRHNQGQLTPISSTRDEMEQTLDNDQNILNNLIDEGDYID
jgi:hypothetical protein